MTTLDQGPSAMRGRAQRNLVLMALIAFLAGALGAGLGAVGVASVVRGRPPAEAAGLHAMVHEVLELTAEQDRALHEIEARFAVRRRELEAQLAEANRGLAAAIEANPSYALEVGEAVDRIHAAMGELQTATVAHIYEMRAILTDEQAAVFDDRIARALAEPPS